MRTLTAQQQTIPVVMAWLAMIVLPNAAGTVYASTVPGILVGGQVYDIEMDMPDVRLSLSILKPAAVSTAEITLYDAPNTLSKQSLAEALMLAGNIGAEITLSTIHALDDASLEGADPLVQFVGTGDVPLYNDIDLSTPGIGEIRISARGMSNKEMPKALVGGASTPVIVGSARVAALIQQERATITNPQTWGIRAAEVAGDAPDATWSLGWSVQEVLNWEGGTDGGSTVVSTNKLAVPFTLANDGTLDSIKVRLHTGNTGAAKVRVYSDNAGLQPGSEMPWQGVSAKAKGAVTIISGLAAGESAVVDALTYTAVAGSKVTPAIGGKDGWAALIGIGAGINGVWAQSGITVTVRGIGYTSTNTAGFPNGSDTTKWTVATPDTKASTSAANLAAAINMTDSANVTATAVYGSPVAGVWNVQLVAVGVGAATNYAVSASDLGKLSPGSLTGGADETTDYTKFSTSGSAADLADSINNRDAANVLATVSGSIVTVEAVTAGTAGNAITLAGDTHLTVSGATLSGGTDAAGVTGTSPGWYTLNSGLELMAGDYWLVIEPDTGTDIIVGIDTAAGDTARATMPFNGTIWAPTISGDMQFRIQTLADLLILKEGSTARGVQTWGSDLRASNGRLFISAGSQRGIAIPGETVTIAVAAYSIAVASVLSPHVVAMEKIIVSYEGNDWEIDAATDPHISVTTGAAIISAIVGNWQSFTVTQNIILAAISLDVPAQTLTGDVRFSIGDGQITVKDGKATLRKERIPASGSAFLPLIFDTPVVLQTGTTYYIIPEDPVDLTGSATSIYADGAWSDATSDINFKIHPLDGALSYTGIEGVRTALYTLNYESKLAGIRAELQDSDGSIVGAGLPINTPKACRQYLLLAMGGTLDAAYSTFTPLLGGELQGNNVQEAMECIDRNVGEASGWRGLECYAVDATATGSGPALDEGDFAQLSARQAGTVHKRIDYDYEGGSNSVRDVVLELVPGTVTGKTDLTLLDNDTDAQASAQKLLKLHGNQRELNSKITDISHEPWDILTQPVFGVDVNWRTASMRVGVPHEVVSVEVLA